MGAQEKRHPDLANFPKQAKQGQAEKSGEAFPAVQTPTQWPAVHKEVVQSGAASGG